jgi:hypothetical protein
MPPWPTLLHDGRWGAATVEVCVAMLQSTADEKKSSCHIRFHSGINMAKIIAGLASSHAFALIDPSDWDARRERNKLGYQQRYGTAPRAHPKIAEENNETRMLKHRNVRNGLDFLRDAVKQSTPDAIILIGDDQNENFVESNLPQIAIYLGDTVVTTQPGPNGQRERGPTYRCHARLAKELLHGLVERDFDVASCGSFPHNELISHAHGPIMRTVDPEAQVPFILVFVNPIHFPAIGPAGAMLGQAIKDILGRNDSEDRVAITPGRISHFTPVILGPITKVLTATAP